MSNYEGKLGEWLKYVQQQVEAVNEPEPEEEKKEQPKARAEERPSAPVEIPDDVVVRDRLGRLPASDSRGIDPESIIADFSLRDRPQQPPVDRSPALFDESEIPEVEDFLPFLRDKVEPAPEPPEDVIPHTPSPDQVYLNFTEGTGEPRPAARKPVEPSIPEPAPVRPQASAVPPVAPQRPEPKPVQPPVQPAQPVVQQPKPVQQMPEVKIKVSRPTPPPAAAASADVAGMWNQLPKHIQVLMAQTPSEVAQNSYKAFKESREELIARLLDPIISLEEAARILNVCPTTVRRYTNRGVLQHIRTAGNQRRFKLSDVLAFLESSGKDVAASQSIGTDTSN